jgi:hypothetical protein
MLKVIINIFLIRSANERRYGPTGRIMRSRLKLNTGSVAYTYSLFAKGGVAENINAYSPGMDQPTPLSNGINLYLPIGGKHRLKVIKGFTYWELLLISIHCSSQS